VNENNNFINKEYTTLYLRMAANGYVFSATAYDDTVPNQFYWGVLTFNVIYIYPDGITPALYLGYGDEEPSLYTVPSPLPEAAYYIERGTSDPSNFILEPISAPGTFLTADVVDGYVYWFPIYTTTYADMLTDLSVWYIGDPEELKKNKLAKEKRKEEEKAYLNRMKRNPRMLEQVKENQMITRNPRQLEQVKGKKAQKLPPIHFKRTLRQSEQGKEEKKEAGPILFTRIARNSEQEDKIETQRVPSIRFSRIPGQLEQKIQTQTVPPIRLGRIPRQLEQKKEEIEVKKEEKVVELPTTTASPDPQATASGCSLQ